MSEGNSTSQTASLWTSLLDLSQKSFYWSPPSPQIGGPSQDDVPEVEMLGTKRFKCREQDTCKDMEPPPPHFPRAVLQSVEVSGGCHCWHGAGGLTLLSVFLFLRLSSLISFSRFTTIKDKLVCANPNDKWAKDIMNQLKDNKHSG